MGQTQTLRLTSQSFDRNFLLLRIEVLYNYLARDSAWRKLKSCRELEFSFWRVKQIAQLSNQSRGLSELLA